MNGSPTAIPAGYEIRLPPVWAPAEVSRFPEPARPRNPLPGMLASVALGLSFWAGIAAIAFR